MVNWLATKNENITQQGKDSLSKRKKKTVKEQLDIHTENYVRTPVKMVKQDALNTCPSTETSKNQAGTIRSKFFRTLENNLRFTTTKQTLNQEKHNFRWYKMSVVFLLALTQLPLQLSGNLQKGSHVHIVEHLSLVPEGIQQIFFTKNCLSV